MIAILLVLSGLIAPGFAHGLIGQRRAMWIVVGLWVAICGALAITPWAILAWLVVLPASVVHAGLRYRWLRGQVRWQWLDPLVAFAVTLVVAITARVFVVEAFKIPSSAMSPTLEIGDHIFINKLRSAQHGDVIVFQMPCDPGHDYIDRVIALANDTVEVRCGVVYVNGKPIANTLVKADDAYRDHDGSQGWSRELTRVSRYRETHGDHSYDTFHSSERATGGIGASARDFPGMEPPRCGEFFQFSPPSERLGTIDGDVEPAQPCTPFRRYRVPAGHLFVLGDNRNNANDSRFWGAVPVANVKGVVTGIWLPFSRLGGVE